MSQLTEPVAPNGETQRKASPRIASLEALRGIAALVVVVWHTMLAFAPERTGLFTQFPKTETWSGSPLFVLMNGNAAVTIFFVLSGFVLCRHYALTGDPRSIVENAIKRYPRLMMPVLLSVLLSCALFRFSLYHFEEVAQQTGSPWLMRFGNSYETPFVPTLWSALKQGAFLTFVRGDSYYNSSLWTMKYEFYASFFIFGGALLLRTSSSLNKAYPFYLMVVMAILAWYVSPWYFAFAVGMALAFFMPPQGFPLLLKVPRIVKAALFAWALLCLGFFQPDGLYQFLRGANPVAVNCFGSALLIILLTEKDADRRWEPVCNYLGHLSFPLYLVHIPILFSLVCGLALSWKGTGPYPIALILPLSLGVCIIASLPLMWINERWLLGLNALFKTRANQQATNSSPVLPHSSQP